MSREEEEGELITASEMAQRLGVGEATVYRYIARGYIPSTRRRWGLRHRYVVRRADFERVAPSLMGLAEDNRIHPNGIRKPGHEATAVGTS